MMFDSIAGDVLPERAQRLLILAAMLIGALKASTARAAEWRYCLAATPAQHKVYMSAPFQNNMTMETLEAAFGQALDRAQVQHDAVQCPRGDESTIAGMKAQAIHYSREVGDRVIDFNWRP
jgi:hypothetical protein